MMQKITFCTLVFINLPYSVSIKKVPGKSKICPEHSVLFIIRKAFDQINEDDHDLFPEDLDLRNIKASPNPSPARAAILVFLETTGRMVSP